MYESLLFLLETFSTTASTATLPSATATATATATTSSAATECVRRSALLCLDDVKHEQFFRAVDLYHTYGILGNYFNLCCLASLLQVIGMDAGKSHPETLNLTRTEQCPTW